MLRLKVGLLIFVAALLIVLVTLHTPGLNGASFWSWSYRTLPPIPIYLGLSLAAIPFFLGLWLDHRRKSLRWMAIGLIMLSSFLLRIASIAYRPDVAGVPAPSLEMIRVMDKNPDVMSYYADAGSLSKIPLRDWMPLFPQLMGGLNLHAKTKPPGPILYWLAMIKLFGINDTTALLGGLGIGLLSILAIPATYLLLKILLNNPDAAMRGASFLALCPGFILFFPMFDPTYILLSTALIGWWFLALRDDRTIYSLLLGVAVAAMCVITFNVLVIGLFMIAMIFLPPIRIARAIKHAAIAAITALILLTLLWMLIGYDPIQTLLHAMQNQKILLAMYAEQRPYPGTIPFDLSDFAMGSGWISFLLVIYYFTKPTHRRLVLFALGQLFVVAALGLLQLETARVWNFMLPLLMIPVGLELSRWPTWARIVPFVAMVFLTAAICQNLKLIY